MTEAAAPSPTRPAAQPADAAAAVRRGAFVGVQLGAAFALGAVACAVIALVWLSSFAYRVGIVVPMTAVGVGLAAVETALLGAQWVLWRRYLRGLPADRAAAVGAAVPARAASFGLHVASYAVALAGVVALVWALAGIGFDQLGFWLLAAAVVLLLLAHSSGGVQYVRASGPAGTPRAHLARLVERSNAKADAELDELERSEPDA